MRRLPFRECKRHFLRVNRLTRMSASQRRTHILVMSVQQGITTISWAQPALSCCLESQPSCDKDQALVTNIPVPLPNRWQTLCKRVCICGVQQGEKNHYDSYITIIIWLSGIVDSVYSRLPAEDHQV